ncbi:PstS family phosphate ABC transporter substrate-binding protein [Jiulongibacter sediminis]|uniref:PstS family phosphate ABC transporter substrate-binding protein n=1 Tax=Jiulongibacter sediminis TaxID=1605367 RepID=UPI0026F295FA|nr:substrate-binding domain-containing protein [Jiulongibacter sediminis]
MIKNLFLSLLVGLFFISCNKTVQNAEEMHVNEGHITVVADESFKNIVDAEINAYMSHYPKTEFDIVYVPEQKAIGLMLSDSAELAIVSRPLTEKEQNYYIARNIEYQPGRMALDAVTLITSKDVNLESISMAQLSSILKGDESEYKLVFDNSSSSNLNLMLDKFEIKELSNTNISAAKGTEDVFNFIENSKKSIGVIGHNWISDEDHKPSMALKARVKILGIQVEDGSVIYPNAQSLRSQSYPLIKTVYLHTTQHRWGVAKGFVRFACSQIGQLVVEKMGLQPYYLIPKKYEMFDTPEISTVE